MICADIKQKFPCFQIIFGGDLKCPCHQQMLDTYVQMKKQ